MVKISAPRTAPFSQSQRLQRMRAVTLGIAGNIPDLF
jgi:hypothetical protein